MFENIDNFTKVKSDRVGAQFTQPDLGTYRRRFEKACNSDRAKRVFDVSAASALLAFLLPTMLLIALCLKLVSRGPVFFAHRRVGRYGKSFQCLKFRSMRIDADAYLQAHLEAHPECREEWKQTKKLKKDPRILPFGTILRKSSLDELPQLINVLRGEMSLVGPRPIVSAEVEYYGDDFPHYLAMRPGISGLWQVSGRNDTSYDERVALDVKYACTRTLKGDFGILLRTVDVVVRGRGAY